MRTPHPVSTVLDLLHDLVGERDALRAGPVRIEFAGSVLPDPSALDAALRGLLEGATFLGVDWKERPAPSELSATQRLAGDCELYLDLVWPLEHAAVALPDDAAARTARLLLETDDARALLERETLARLARRAAAIAGDLVVRLQLATEDHDALPAICESLGREADPVWLHVVPADEQARHTLGGNLQGLELAARKGGVNLSVSGLGRWAEGAPANHLLAWNVMHTLLRGAFKRSAGICPFPFLMLRQASGGGWRLCPRPDGPPAGDSPDPPDWNGEPARGVRRSFHAGKAEGPCAGCALFWRVQADLERD